MKVIEFVCIGNNGRSPVAELLARNRLVSLRADKEYGVASSGTNVEYTQRFIRGEEKDAGVAKFILGAAIKAGLYSEGQRAEIEALDSNDVDGLVRHAIDVTPTLMETERTHMKNLLAERGIPGQIKPGRDQLVVSPDRRLILTMDKKVLGAVQAAYEGSSNKPGMFTLPMYATREDREVANAFGGSREDYIRTLDQLQREVPLAIDRAVGA